MSCQFNSHLIVCLHCTILDSSTVSSLYVHGMQTIATCTVFVRFQGTWLYACRLLPSVQYLWGLIVCMHSNCRLLPFVQYCSSINIFMMYRKRRSSEETDADTSSISEDFDKPPRKKWLSVSLIIYCGCQSIFDMEGHCILALSTITWSTVVIARGREFVAISRPKFEGVARGQGGFMSP